MQPRLQVPSNQAEQGTDESENVEIAEDMQVMGTILRENIQQLYADGHAHLSQVHHGATAPLVRPPLAEHIPGYGVVFQMRVAPPRDEETPRESDQEETSTRWEQTRRKLRGEPTANWTLNSTCTQCHAVANGIRDSCPSFPCQQFADCSSCHASSARPIHNSLGPAQLWPNTLTQDERTDLMRVLRPDSRSPLNRASLVDRIVETLAENGHNMRHLEETHRVTVSLSYEWTRSREQKAKPEAGHNQTSHANQEVESALTRFDWQLSSGTEWPSTWAPSASSGKDQPITRELAGDLQMKQGMFDQAVHSYEQVAKALDLPARFAANTATDAHRELLRKLSRSYQVLDRMDESRKRVLELTGLNDGDSNHEFIRRLTGALADRSPTADEVRVFLDDRSADAQSKLVDRLLREERVQRSKTMPVDRRTGQPDRVKSVLPSRITVSSTKGQLDSVGENKISRGAFARSLTI